MEVHGSPYPITKHPKGFFRTQTGIKQIKSDLLVLLLTNPGERVMLPEFGTPLRELLFEPNDTVSSERAREMIINSINTWEPRVIIESLDVGVLSENSRHPDDTLDQLDHVLSIRIVFYNPENINDLQELKLEIPLAGGNNA